MISDLLFFYSGFCLGCLIFLAFLYYIGYSVVGLVQGCRTCIFLLCSKIYVGLVASVLSFNTPLIAWFRVCTMVGK